MWTPLNTANSVAGDFFGNKRVSFLHYIFRFDMINLCPPGGKSGEIGCSEYFDLLQYENIGKVVNQAKLAVLNWVKLAIPSRSEPLWWEKI